MEKKWIAIGIILAIMCVCVVMSIPIIEVDYTVKEPYSAMETYYVKEPYKVCVPLRYETSGWDTHNHFWSDKFDLGVRVKNTDDVCGDFWVKFHAVGTQGTKDYPTSFESLFSGESHYFEHTFSGSYQPGCSYEVEQFGKIVTKYQEVAKERTVTEYRDVTKYEYISAFVYLMQD